MRRALIACVLLTCAACGGGGSPSSPSPTIAQVAGLWRATARLTGVSGGECVGAALGAAIGSASEATIQVSQTGSALTATVTSLSDGSTCQYNGTAGSNSLTLNFQRCDLGILRLQCANGAIRDLAIQTDSITATVTGSTATGTEAETYNVFIGGTTTPISLMTLNSSFTATKQ